MAMDYRYRYFVFDYDSAGIREDSSALEQVEGGDRGPVIGPCDNGLDLGEEEDSPVYVRVQSEAETVHGEGRGRVSRAIVT